MGFLVLAKTEILQSENTEYLGSECCLEQHLFLLDNGYSVLDKTEVDKPIYLGQN